MRWGFPDTAFPWITYVEASDAASMQERITSALAAIGALQSDYVVSALDLTGCGAGSDFIARIEYSDPRGVPGIFAVVDGEAVVVREPPPALEMSVFVYTATNRVELAAAKARAGIAPEVVFEDIGLTDAQIIGVEFAGASSDRKIMAIEILQTPPVLA